MLEPKRHLMTWNLAAQRIKGYAPDEGVGCQFGASYALECSRSTCR
jgi:hypothetical protein